MTDLLDDIVIPESHPVDLDQLDQWAFEVGNEPVIALIAELRAYRTGHARPSPNGRAHGAYVHVCAGCGREFDSNRRQLPGKRSWCGRAECKKEAASQRARDYRSRNSKEAK